MQTSTLKVGDLVEVRSREEILCTLDARGELDGMPFMPEMLQYCGKRFRVFKRAHKTCDYSGEWPHRVRWVNDCVHLEMRCSGEAHDNCQAGCLIYWKGAWLKAVKPGDPQVEVPLQQLTSPKASEFALCKVDALYANTCSVSESVKTYRCQATQIPAASTACPWWDLRQYLQDYFSGNVPLRRVVDALVYSIYFHISQLGIGLGKPMRWLYNTTHKLWGGTRFPETPGSIPAGERTPSVSLGLQPGELVRVKSHDEILKTITVDRQNRGMYWSAELVPYCGKELRVLSRVSRLIDEKTSRMIEMKNACIVLDGAVCDARYSPCRMLCPKSMFGYFREVWLERVDSGQEKHAEDPASTFACK